MVDEIQGTVTSVRGCEAHEADCGLGEITDGAGAKFVFLRETAYGWLKKGEQVKFRAQQHTGLKCLAATLCDGCCKQAVNIVVVSGTPPALPSVTKQAKDVKFVPTIPADRQTFSSVASANVKSRQEAERLHKKVTVPVLGDEVKPKLKAKAVAVITATVATVTKVKSGSSGAWDARMKTLEELVVGLVKSMNERLPLPPYPPPAARN